MAKTKKKTKTKLSKRAVKARQAELRRKKTAEFQRRSKAAKKGWKKRKAADRAVKKNLQKKWSIYETVKKVPKELNKYQRAAKRKRNRQASEILKVRNPKKRKKAWDEFIEDLIEDMGDIDGLEWEVISQYRKRT